MNRAPTLFKYLPEFRYCCKRQCMHKAHFNPNPSHGNFNHFGKLWKPFCFTIGVGAASFVGATIWEYENMRAHSQSMMKIPLRLYKKLKENHHNRFNGNRSIVSDIKHKWNSLSAGEKLFVPICLINVLVFGAWRVPRLQPLMLKYFSSTPMSDTVCLPMLLCTFSHYSALHLLANMYVLHSFSTGAVHSLGVEQFLALYLTAGVFSSFTSCIYKVVTKRPNVSVGASGAIMAILAYVCTVYPDTRLGIILVPAITFSAGAAIKVIMALDTTGVLLGWTFFDHAAHLGGAVCGIAWAHWGTQMLWKKREPILQYWHEIRGPIK